MEVQAATAGKTEAIEWTLADAIELYPALSALADDCGYCMAMLGSVLKNGRGRDLDLLMRPLHGRLQLRDAFLARFGGRLVKRRLNKAHMIDGYKIELGGREFDFIFGEFWELGMVRAWAKKSSKSES